MKLFGWRAFRNIWEAYVDPDGGVAGRVHDEKRAAQFPDPAALIVAGQIFDERAPDLERSPADLDLGRAGIRDRGHPVAEQIQHVRRVEGRPDGRDRLRFGNPPGRGEHRGAAQAVADQERRRHAGAPQLIGGGDDILDIRSKAGVPEFAFAAAKAGEIEPERGDAERREMARDPRRRQRVLAAGETMGEQGVSRGSSFGEFQPAGKSVSVRALEIETFGRHGAFLLRLFVRGLVPAAGVEPALPLPGNGF